MHGSIEGCPQLQTMSELAVDLVLLVAVRCGPAAGWVLDPSTIEPWLGPWPCRRVSPRHAMSLLPDTGRRWTRCRRAQCGPRTVSFMWVELLYRLPVHDPISRYPRGHRFGRSWMLGRTDGGFAARQDFARFREHDPRRLQPVVGKTCPVKASMSEGKYSLRTQPGRPKVHPTNPDTAGSGTERRRWRRRRFPRDGFGRPRWLAGCAERTLTKNAAPAPPIRFTPPSGQGSPAKHCPKRVLPQQAPSWVPRRCRSTTMQPTRAAIAGPLITLQFMAADPTPARSFLRGHVPRRGCRCC